MVQTPISNEFSIFQPIVNLYHEFLSVEILILLQQFPTIFTLLISTFSFNITKHRALFLGKKVSDLGYDKGEGDTFQALEVAGDRTNNLHYNKKFILISTSVILLLLVTDFKMLYTFVSHKKSSVKPCSCILPEKECPKDSYFL
jgi:hypothetical protein